ncbi:homeobox-leucine zipper protein HOX11-like [Ananas comosus]|uniref:Homeobox-leucine zipper protein HOX11-like n=1 Tax=Ananas comosus TaxID=4615 RepID=A0A6P5GNE8_ANACO|nr:homeobox-leucine zipper protein HOX11-like [Ananas comosus]
MELGLSLRVGYGRGGEEVEREEEEEEEEEEEVVRVMSKGFREREERERSGGGGGGGGGGYGDPLVSLSLLPPSASPKSLLGFLPPWAPLETRNVDVAIQRFDVNRPPPPPPLLLEETEEGTAMSPSPNNSAVSAPKPGGSPAGGDGERAGSKGSDEDENGLGRKKLRLSKEQSAFLEESFKEHNTLNPKQKLALAKQLNLRPRQVEVWFQNRRARTKLKQTEVDCEYLKRCCETLTEENRRLQREVAELRALKAAAAAHPFVLRRFVL